MSTLGLPAVFRGAFLEIAATTADFYRATFGAHVIGEVEVNIRKEPKRPLRLWTNGADRVYLTLSQERQLLPAPVSGVFHVHGIAHELAHIVLYRMLVNISILPPGWGEGWAVYLASFWAVPHLYQKFGPTLWPYPYDYLATEGPQRYRRRPQPASAGPPGVLRAVRTLDRLEQSLGRARVRARLRRLLRRRRVASEFAVEIDSLIAANRLSLAGARC